MQRRPVTIDYVTPRNDMTTFLLMGATLLAFGADTAGNAGLADQGLALKKPGANGRA